MPRFFNFVRVNLLIPPWFIFTSSVFVYPSKPLFKFFLKPVKPKGSQTCIHYDLEIIQWDINYDYCDAKMSVVLILSGFRFYTVFDKNVPCQLLRLNFKNNSDYFDYDFSFKLSAIIRLCSSRVALTELERERK